MTIPDRLLELGTWKEINLYIFIRRLQKKDPYVRVSTFDIAREFKISRMTACRLLKRLKDMGAVSEVDVTGNVTDDVTENVTVQKAVLTANNQLVTCAQKNGNVTKNVTKNVTTIEQRKAAFTETLKPFLGQYSSDMLNAFWMYWTEPNKSNTRMRFEMEKTWSLEGRLATWNRNNKNKRYGTRKQTAEERQQADRRSAAETFMRLDEERRANLRSGDSKEIW